MKFIRIVGSLLPLALLLPVLCLAQGPAQTDDIAKLREQIAAQQKQLDEQRQALDAAQKALDSQQKLLDRLAAAQGAPAAAPRPSAAAPLVPPAAPAAPAAEVDAKGRAFSPLAFHIGGADFTPSGFMDFSTVWRSTNIGSGVATSFAGVPLSNTAAGRMAEFRSSAANSRVALTITDNPTKNTTVTGYVEGDFYGNQPTSLFVTSNSNTFRMRHFWVNVEKGKWEVLGGQTWTLLTPNRVGVSQVSSNVFVGLGEDSNYMPGLIWGRPGQIRVVYHPDKHWSHRRCGGEPRTVRHHRGHAARVRRHSGGQREPFRDAQRAAGHHRQNRLRHAGVRQGAALRAGRLLQPVPRLTRAGQVLRRPGRGRRRSTPSWRWPRTSA